MSACEQACGDWILCSNCCHRCGGVLLTFGGAAIVVCPRCAIWLLDTCCCFFFYKSKIEGGGTEEDELGEGGEGEEEEEEGGEVKMAKKTLEGMHV